MKKWTLLSLLLILSLSFYNRANAQVRVHVNINIGSQPEWGPAGYDEAQYYYMPDIETYYCVPSGQFIYLDNGRWMFSASLPACHAGYDLHAGYKVVINRPNAYYYFNEDRARYSGYRNYYGRQECRDRYRYNDRYDERRYSRHDDGEWRENGHGHGRGRALGHWKHRGWDRD